MQQVQKKIKDMTVQKSRQVVSKFANSCRSKDDLVTRFIALNPIKSSIFPSVILVEWANALTGTVLSRLVGVHEQIRPNQLAFSCVAGNACTMSEYNRLKSLLLDMKTTRGNPETELNRQRDMEARRALVDTMFKYLDANRDGRLVAEELEKVGGGQRQLIFPVDLSYCLWLD